MSLDEDRPIILGLCGKAGTGKTSVGNMLAPQTQFANNTIGNEQDLLTSNADMSFFHEHVIWDHKFFAMPLYKLVSIKDSTEGYLSDDRVRYQIHETLLDIFSGNPLYGAPPYSELVKMTEEIAAMPLPAEGKPRAFLQDVGEMCRSVDPDCFVKHTKSAIYRDFLAKKVEFERQARLRAAEDPDTPERDFMYVCVVSDIRMENEARMIAEESNGVVVRFDASDEVRIDRLTERDGRVPTGLNHFTEQLDIPEDLFSAILDTDEMDLVDQALDTRRTLFNTLGIR